MKILARLSIIIFFFVIISSFFSCSDVENRFGLPGQTTQVTISLGIPPENPSAADNTFWKTIRSIFINDAVAQAAPAAFGSINVTVTAAGMTLVQQTFPGTGTIALTVPSGSSRIFTVTAYTAAADPSAALSFRGTTTIDLEAGASVTVPVAMGLHETKLVVPDPGPTGTPNLRIVQIDNLTTPNWVAKTGANIGFTATFKPWDVDFDARGRIYIATNYPVSGGAKVIRINNINDTPYFNVVDNGTTGIVALAVDRPRNYVYFASSTILKRVNIDGTGLSGNYIINSGVAPVTGINGLSIDPNGILYIAGLTTGSLPRVFRYDPTAQSVTHAYSTNLVSPVEDVLYKAPYVYVANPSGANGVKIIQLDATLTFVAGYGIAATAFPSTATGAFYGPRRFLAIRNDVIIMIDEAGGSSDFDKLLSISDMTGTGWTNFGTYGAGTNQFSFFYGC